MRLRCDPEHFGDEELQLVHVARTLREAERVEDVLTLAGIEYAAVPERYRARVLLVFPTIRIGAFFYVRVGEADAAHDALGEAGLRATVARRSP